MTWSLVLGYEPWEAVVADLNVKVKAMTADQGEVGFGGQHARGQVDIKHLTGAQCVGQLTVTAKVSVEGHDPCHLGVWEAGRLDTVDGCHCRQVGHVDCRVWWSSLSGHVRWVTA